MTEKMPCPSWGLPAARCRVGAELAKVKDSVCSACYAMKGRYSFGKVQDKLERRYQGLFNPLWTPSMIFMIRWYCDKYFRLFDSGDIQGENHLRNIVTIAENVPDVKIWMPTREIETVRAALRELVEFPSNLVVRVSAVKIDGKPPKGVRNASTVVSNPDEATCPAPGNRNQCGECRDCWDPAVKNVSYALH